jgi:hypothetical protein
MNKIFRVLGIMLCFCLGYMASRFLVKGTRWDNPPSVSVVGVHTQQYVPVMRIIPIEPEKIKAMPDLVPDFKGKPAAKRITWLLHGDWEINATEREDGKPSERFKESWHIQKNKDKDSNIWYDKYRGEKFTLHATEQGDILVWRRYLGREFHFSVHRSSYGVLTMTDQDGDHYMAIRTDGGD